MDIVHFPHPVLRLKSGDVTRIDDRFRALIDEMFDLMYEANGIGLAANQVGLPLRFFIMNPSGDPELADEEQVFINPFIKNRKGGAVGEEGCLSLPGLYGDVRRAEEIVVEAFDLSGQGFRATLKELPARVVQHEYDHIEGILFIDRLADAQQAELRSKLQPFEDEWRGRQQAGAESSDADLLARLKAIAASGQLPPG